MDEVYLGIGSNVGERLHYLASAVSQLKRTRAIEVTAISGIYETEPVGIKGQRGFLNAALRIETSLNPEELLSCIKSLEGALGRRQTVRWGPREIDIDILLYGNLVLQKAPLIIPHAEMNNRRFVLQPLAEIAAEAVHPVVHETIRQLFAGCTDPSSVERSEVLTENFLSLVEG